MFQSIGNIFKLILFFIGLWKERDARRVKRKEEVAKRIVDAFKETDPKTQASRLNGVIADLNRMR